MRGLEARSAGLFVLLAALSSPSMALDQSEAGRSMAVDALFAEIGADQPGCAVGVMNADRFVHLKGYGLANLEHGAAITGDSRFNIASNSKQFTALAIAQLAVAGKLSLDDDIRVHLPELAEFERPIFIRDLMHHTSGLREHFYLMLLRGTNLEEVAPREALWLIARQRTLNFAPRSDWDYSNTNYFLMSQIVERVSKIAFPDYIKANIFDPLGMTASQVRTNRQLVIPQRATGYSPDGRGGWLVTEPLYNVSGSGNIIMPLRDLMAYHRDALEGGIVWTPAVSAIMLSPAILDSGANAMEGRKFGGDTFTSYAGGLMTRSIAGHNAVEHGGRLSGLRSQYTRFPETQLGIAVFCNGDLVDPDAQVAKIAKIYLPARNAEASVAPPTENAAGSSQPPPFDQPLSDDIKRALIGEYFSEELAVTYQIKQGEDGALEIFMPETMLLVAGTDGAFWTNASGRSISNGFMTLALEQAEDGTIVSFALSAPRARGLRFERVSDKRR